MKKIVTLFVCALLMVSCATQKITRIEKYPKMYEEKPLSILIMPPINNTTKVEAKEYFYSTLASPLAEKGYYVFSPFLSMNLLKQESAYDSEMFINGSLAAFHNVFKADAVLFTTINKWKKNNITSTITVDIEYLLKSAKTNEILFHRKGELDVSCAATNNGGLLGLAINALTTALTDKIVAARRCNWYVLSDLPYGKYHPSYAKDQQIKVGETDFSGRVSK